MNRVPKDILELIVSFCKSKDDIALTCKSLHDAVMRVRLRNNCWWTLNSTYENRKFLEKWKPNTFTCNTPNDIVWLSSINTGFVKTLIINKAEVAHIEKFPTSVETVALFTNDDCPCLFIHVWTKTLKKLFVSSSCTMSQACVAKLPPDLTHLHIGILSQDRVKFPKALEHLNIDHYYECEPVKLVLPDSLKILKLPYNLNRWFVKWPPFLTHLYTSNSFNQNIDDLPDSLEFLMLGGSFKTVIGKWPSSLKILLCFSETLEHIGEVPNHVKIVDMYTRLGIRLANYWFF